MIFLLLFLLLYKSDNAILRELGYISLVLAGLIKIYPLFFGVFLLKDKKIFASARVAVYFFSIFFLSFNYIIAYLDANVFSPSKFCNSAATEFFFCYLLVRSFNQAALRKHA